MSPVDYKRWLVPAAGGIGVSLLILAVVVWGVRIVPPAKEAGTTSAPVPTLIVGAPEDADRIRQELVHDLEPLFLPTEHNTSVLKLPLQTRREPAAMAVTIQPKLAVSESGGGVPFPDAFEVPQRPADVLSDREQPDLWPEMGRADVNIPALAPRLAYVEVRTAKTGDAVLQETVAKIDEPEAPTGLWSPVEFLVAVDSVGIVGSSVITDSTPSEEVETFFRNFVVKKLRLGARLAPGFYSVRIGP